MEENVLSIRNVSKKYGNKFANDNINIDIKSGMFGLLGPNGAGKTTLMKMIATITRPTSGEIILDGQLMNNDEETRAKIGYLPQEFEMYKNMTAYETLDYLAILSGIRNRKDLINETLKKVNMYKERNTKFGAMSGGMKRRIGIAQAIIHDPRVIIVDEPTAGLDPEERIRFRNMLCEIAKDKIVILSTHIVGDIEATCNDIAILNKGKIEFKGTIEEILHMVQGKVYKLSVPMNEVDKIKSQYLVSSVKFLGNKAEVKILADKIDNANVKAVEADIEDAYLYLMNVSERGRKEC